jgi:hypothetical protein
LRKATKSTNQGNTMEKKTNGLKKEIATFSSEKGLTLNITTKEQAIAIFSGKDGLSSFVTKIKESLKTDLPKDLSKKKNRTIIISQASKVSKAKVLLNKYGLDLTSEWRIKTKAVNANLQQMRKEMDELRDNTRATVTLWENKEKERVANHEAVINNLKTFSDREDENRAKYSLEELKARLETIEAININESLEEYELAGIKAKKGSIAILKQLINEEEIIINQAIELERIKAQEAKRIQKQKDEELKRQAIEAERARAKKEADKKAELEKQRLAKVEAEKLEAIRLKKEADKKAEQAKIEAEEAKIQAEKQRILMEERAKIQKQLAEEARIEAKLQAKLEQERLKEQARLQAEAMRIKAKAQAEAKAEQARIEAEEAKIQAIEQAKQSELQRQKAEQARLKLEQEKLEADRAYVGSIRREAKRGLMELGLTNEKAKEIVLAISKGKIPNISIKY